MANNPLQRCALIQELGSRRIRLTTQRRVLLQTIQEAKGHLDAATILNLARQRDANIDKATVYRTLRLLKRLRLIDELDLMHLTGERHYYEARTRKNQVHLACFRCGGIEEFSSRLFEKLQDEITSQIGFEITVSRLEVGGLCKVCRSEKKADLRSGRGDSRLRIVKKS
jgi:Fur family ferric uptake transcriptional regulator